MNGTDYDKMLYDRAANMLRVQGIISIVFGGLGVLFGLAVMVLLGFLVVSIASSTDAIEMFLTGIGLFVFLVIPSLYFVISGATLVRHPAPSVARTLTIINLVVSLLSSNVVILIFAIISLTQISDYERHHLRKK